jgi:nitrate reductase gamma subunit
MSAPYGFLFGVYPYICLHHFSAWKSDPLRPEPVQLEKRFFADVARRHIARGSNLFHIGVLFLFFGHLIGLLMPHALYGIFISAPSKQMLAIVSGGIAGVLCFIGLTLLIHRRVFDARIRATSHPTDIAILVILWVQLVIGLVTLPFSWHHSDGSVHARAR